jgi:hypothetical protein
VSSTETHVSFFVGDGEVTEPTTSQLHEGEVGSANFSLGECSLVVFEMKKKRFHLIQIDVLNHNATNNVIYDCVLSGGDERDEDSTTKKK